MKRLLSLILLAALLWAMTLAMANLNHVHPSRQVAAVGAMTPILQSLCAYGLKLPFAHPGHHWSLLALSLAVGVVLSFVERRKV